MSGEVPPVAGKECSLCADGHPLPRGPRPPLTDGACPTCHGPGGEVANEDAIVDKAMPPRTKGDDPRALTIAFDFDGTWTRDPEGLRAVVLLLQARGHTCILLTGRGDEHTWGHEVRAAIGALMPIVFAANSWKRDAAKAAGFEVDIFLDDHPEYIAAQDPRLTVGRAPLAAATKGDDRILDTATLAAAREMAIALADTPVGAMVTSFLGHIGALTAAHEAELATVRARVDALESDKRDVGSEAT